MSLFKEIFSIAYESGYCGNTWNATVEFLRDSSFGKLLESNDFSFDGLIYENFVCGRLDFENEKNNLYSPDTVINVLL